MLEKNKSKSKSKAKAKAKGQKKAASLRTQVPLVQLMKEEAFADVEDVTAIVEFLETFQKIVDPRAQHPSQLISIKIPVPLLDAFKSRAKFLNIPYQSLIKKLMVEWLGKSVS